jgi:hypothetical protein
MPTLQLVPMSQRLDFIVIGAAKSGTTALHEYLRTHPDLYLPPSKEAPFFSEDLIYERGWGSWFGKAFPNNAQGVYGKITPHYMAGAPYGDRVIGAKYGDAPPDEVIPLRIHDLFPNVRLVAILRDPVERCISHHRMTMLLGSELRTLEQAVEDLLTPSALDQARRAPTELNGYIAWGEYARILRPYYERFGSDSIRVFFTTELERRPEKVVRDVLDFIGVDSAFVPPNLGRRYYEGSRKRRIPWLDLSRLQENVSRDPTARRVWHLLPAPLRRRTAVSFEAAHYRVRMWNRVKVQETETIDETVNAKLREHFSADTSKLAVLIGRDVPWCARYSTTPASPL